SESCPRLAWAWPRLFSAAATSRCTGPCVFSASVSVFCARVSASENFPARSSSMIFVVWALMLCANAGVTAQALAASASPSSNPACRNPACPSDFMLHWSRQTGGAFKAFAALLLRPRVGGQPHQNLAQFRTRSDPFREIQPQRPPFRLHVHAVRVATAAAPIGSLGAQQLRCIEIHRLAMIFIHVL